MGVTRPSPCFLDQMIPLSAFGGMKRWRSSDGRRLYEWDDLHGEIEGDNKRGEHVGVFHPITGALIKPAVRGRIIDV